MTARRQDAEVAGTRWQHRASR